MIWVMAAAFKRVSHDRWALRPLPASETTYMTGMSPSRLSLLHGINTRSNPVRGAKNFQYLSARNRLAIVAHNPVCQVTSGIRTGPPFHLKLQAVVGDGRASSVATETAP